MEKLLNAGNGEVETEPGSASSLPLLVPQSWEDAASEVRSQLFSALADVEIRSDRQYEGLKKRIVRLEGRASLLTMNEEMKTFLVMTGISIAAALLVPIIQGAVEKWRRSQ